MRKNIATMIVPLCLIGIPMLTMCNSKHQNTVEETSDCPLDTPTLVIQTGGKMMIPSKMGDTVGDIPVGAQTQHTTIIRNNGDIDLHMDTIICSHGDLTVSPSWDQIPKDVIIGVATYITPQKPGAIDRKVEIYFKEARKPYVIEFTGNAVPQDNENN